MLQSPCAWRTPSALLVLPPGEWVVLLRGQPVWNDVGIRFDEGSDSGQRFTRGSLRARNDCMNGAALETLISFDTDVEILHAQPHARLSVRADCIFAYDGTVKPTQQSGEFCSFTGQGNVAVAVGRDFGMLPVENGRERIIACSAVRAWQGTLHFETQNGAAIYRVTGHGTVWWGT